MTIPRLTDFEGHWTVQREIEDHLVEQTGQFQGQASFTRDALGLAYAEAGQLRFGTSAWAATRRYFWRDARDAIDVHFEDGRFFHRIALEGARPNSDHFCDPDQYDVTYDFAQWPLWTSHWRVTGPRKDYEMRSRYRPVPVSSE